MKKIIFSILAIAAVVGLSSCEKHKQHFPLDPIGDEISEFQLHYMEGVNNVVANNFDYTYLNGELISSSGGSGTLYPYNGIPYGGAGGRFFFGKIGSNNIQLFRGDETTPAYECNVNLTKRKQNVIIYDITKDPIVLDNGFPYWADRPQAATSEGWGTDSVVKIQFVNLLFEEVTLDPTTQKMVSGTPYPGKLQYQFQRVGNIRNPQGVIIGTEPDTWFNMGEPVGFGETTGFQMIVIHKETWNSSGYQRLNYRILDENGDELMKWNGTTMVKYSDYWNAYIGRVYTHFFRGVRTKAISSDPGKTVGSPQCNVSQWASL